MRTYREYQIAFDAELYDALVERAVDFWENYVVPGNPPEMERADSTTQRWVAERFPANVAPIERATDAEEALMREYLDAKNAKLEAEAALEQVETRLKLAIGELDESFVYHALRQRCLETLQGLAPRRLPRRRRRTETVRRNARALRENGSGR